jgi:hypothetical protein
LPPYVRTASFSLVSFFFCSFTHTPKRPVDAGLPDIAPSVLAFPFYSTRKQRGNCISILATVRVYYILQLHVFVCCPFTGKSPRMFDFGIKTSCHLLRHCFCVRSGISAAIAPQLLPPCVCTASFSLMSTSSAHLPVRPLAPASAPQFLSPCICTRFFSCPLTRTSNREGLVGIQDITPSAPTLHFNSTRNQRGNCTPILATVRLNCILQLAVFDCCPFTRTFIFSVDARVQDIMPSVTTLFIRSTRNQSGNCRPVLATVRL